MSELKDLTEKQIIEKFDIIAKHKEFGASVVTPRMIGYLLKHGVDLDKISTKEIMQKVYDEYIGEASYELSIEMNHNKELIATFLATSDKEAMQPQLTNGLKFDYKKNTIEILGHQFKIKQFPAELLGTLKNI